MLQPDLILVDIDQQRNAWEASRRHPLISSCIHTTYNLSMGCGIIDNQTSSDTMRAHQLSDIKALAASALNWLMTIGVVPLTIEKQSGKPAKIIIPVPESISLFVRTTEFGAVEYHATPKSCAALLGLANYAHHSAPSVIVWAKGTTPPTSTGKLITPVARLEANGRLVSYLTSRIIVAESIKSNPFHVSQTQKKTNNDTDGVMWNVPDEVTAAAEQQRIAGVENTQRKQYHAHSENWAAGGMPSASIELNRLEAESQPREYFLSAERDLVRQVTAESPIAYLAALQQYNDEAIYNVFSIPRFIRTGEGTATSKQNETAQHMLNTHMQGIRTQLEDFLNDALHLASLSAHHDKDHTPVELEDPRSDNKRRKVTVVGALLVPKAEILEMSDRGIITEEETHTLLRRSLGLPVHTSATEPQNTKNTQQTPEAKQDEQSKTKDQPDKKETPENTDQSIKSNK